MKKAFLVVLALAGCGGGPDFSGHYTGTLSDSTTCSDGSGGTSSVAGSWDVVESGSSLTITTSGTCNPFAATINGSSASLQQKTCAPTSSSAGTTTATFTSGTLSLNGKTLAVTVMGSDAIVLTSGASATCAETLTGNLTKP